MHDAFLNRVLISLLGIHVAEHLLQQFCREHLSHHIEYLISAQRLADFGETLQQLS